MRAMSYTAEAQKVIDYQSVPYNHPEDIEVGNFNLEYGGAKYRQRRL